MAEGPPSSLSSMSTDGPTVRAAPASSDRAQAALRLMHAVTQAAPVAPAAWSSGWMAHGPLLLPSTVRASDLSPDLRRQAAAGSAPTAVPPPLAHRAEMTAYASPSPDGTTLYAVLTSRIATSQHRCRLFALDTREMVKDDDAPTGPVAASATLVAHARRPGRPARLAVAARTQALFHHAWHDEPVEQDANKPETPATTAWTGSVRAPSVISYGRTHAVEWLHEDLIDGSPLVISDHHPGAVLQLANALNLVWRHHTTFRRTRPRPWAGWQVSALLDQASRADRDGGPQDIAKLRRAVLHLSSRSVVVAHGPRHGDPVLGNVLRTNAGHLVLLDWEHAGPGLLATDLVKLSLSMPTVRQGWQLLEDTAPHVLENNNHRGPTTAPWREQVALALLLWLSGWRTQQRAHRRSGRTAAFDRRLRRRLELLNAALDG